MLQTLNLNGVGIEIGVKTGRYSQAILERSQLHLYLLDAWRHFETGYTDRHNTSTSTHLSFMTKTIERLKEFEGRFTVIRDTSENGARLFNDEYFDFAYIDANHSYESCLHDLNLWFPKVKKGGVIAGHDYMSRIPNVNAPSNKSLIDVKSAVDEFFGKRGISFRVTDERYPSWYCIKPL